MSEKSKPLTIDFANLGGPVYVGRDRGALARERFGLDDQDFDRQSVVRVKVPDDTYSINSSYFLGLFGPSIRNLGTRELFFDKYRFEIPSRFSERIESYVARALHEQRSLL